MLVIPTKIVNLIKGFFSGDVESRHFAISVLIAFFPAVIIGVLAVDFIKSVLFSPIVVAIALIVGALIIFWVESRQFEHKTLDATKITFKQALLVGLAQCVAMIPGTSRSGATIVGGCLRAYHVRLLQNSLSSLLCQPCWVLQLLTWLKMLTY